MKIKIKSFREWVSDYENNILNEAKDSKYLRNLIISQLKLDKVISSQNGEDITLDSLNTKELKSNLKNWQLYSKINKQDRKEAELMLQNPENKRLADLLDVLTKNPLVGKSISDIVDSDDQDKSDDKNDEDENEDKDKENDTKDKNEDKNEDEDDLEDLLK